MQSKKLTPLEILQRQKVDLQTRVNELSESIENQSKYLQLNFVPLLRDNIMESTVSKMPVPLQMLAGNFLQKEKKTEIQVLSVRKVSRVIAIVIAEIAPFFLKGKRGAIFSFLLKHFTRWLFR